MKREATGKVCVSRGGRRALAMLLSAALALTGLFPQGSGVGPQKVYAHWADVYINKLASQNVMKGDLDGNMYPDRNITRAEFAVMLNQAFGFTDRGGAAFSDVPANAWYANAMSVASYQGFLTGFNGRGNPEGYLTREEAVTMLCKALKIEEQPVDYMNFNDSDAFSNWSRGYINAAVQKNMLAGYPDNTFRPGNPITRGEAAAMLSQTAGEIVQSNSQVYLGYVRGNVTLTESGAGLRNTTIEGDLYITEGVKTGYVFLDNVTVLGEIIISGGGWSNTNENSVVMTDCDAEKVIIDLNHDQILSLIAQGYSDIDTVVVKTDAFLEEDNVKGKAFRNVDLAGDGATLNLTGAFERVRLMKPGNTLKLNKGSIEELVADEDGPDCEVYLENKTLVEELYIDGPVHVYGKGDIEYLYAGADGGVVEQLPDEIEIRPGVTVNVNGKDMTYLDAETDSLSPRIVSGYPEVKSIQLTSADGVVMGNKPGTVYWVVKEEEDSAPDEDIMVEPNEDKEIVKSGTVNLADAEEEITAKLSGLTSGGKYELYVMLEDARGNYSRIRSESFETDDKTAPKFVSGYPRAVGVYEEPETSSSGAIITPGDHKISIEAVADKDCTLYYAVLPSKSAAPTAKDVTDGKVPGALVKGSAAAGKNEMVRVAAGGLEEATPYDLYIALKDARGNISTLSRQSVSTLDVTAPEFVSLRTGTVAETTVQIVAMTDEKATLYWAVYPLNAEFPPSFMSSGVTVTTGSGIVPSAEKEAARQQAIISGNNAVKYGKTSVTFDRETTFTISGLQGQKTYDVYLLLEDAAGNRQIVRNMKITTKDNVNPTAALGFDDTQVSEDGNPPVGSDIRIVFSEPVYAGGKDVPALTTLGGIATDQLSSYIKLYNVSADPREEVPIDFEKVEWSEEDEHTEAIFSTSSVASDAAIGLLNGNNYVFELSRDIKDMTGNSLQPGSEEQSLVQGSMVRMEPFHTMAPFISLRDVGTSDQFHYRFEIDPKIKMASDTLLYDTVLESDHLITVEIYRKVVSEGATTVEFTDADRITNPGGTGEGYTEFTLDEGKFIPLQTLIDGTVSADYGRFNDLEKVQYAVKILALEANTDAQNWNGEVRLTLRGVAGSKGDLEALAANVADLSFDDFLKSDRAGTLTVVSDPSKLVLSKYFQDMVAPVFLEDYPRLQAGDTTVSVSMLLDKPATVYWVIAPKGAITTTPTAVQLKSGRLSVQGGKTGSFEVAEGRIVTSDYIRNLTAEEEYDFYYMPSASRDGVIGKKEIAMEPARTPVFTNSTPIQISNGPGTVTIEVGLDKNSAEGTVYWAAYPLNAYVNSTPSALAISGENRDPGKAPVSSGQISLQAGETGTITVDKLEAGTYYDFFVTAINPLGNPRNPDDWEEIRALRPITPQDTNKPEVGSAVTSITGYNAGPPARVSGSVTINFTEGLYYRDTSAGGAAGLWQPFTAAMVADLRGTDSIAVGSATAIGRSDQTDGAINSITINFTGVYNGATLYYEKLLGDGVNTSGYLKMVLQVNGTAADSFAGTQWIVEFQDKLS